MNEILKDGSETGESVADKINDGFKEVTTFEYAVLPAAHVVVGTSWKDVLKLNTQTLPIGVYLIRVHGLWTINSTSRSGQFRFSVDAGVSWTERSLESKDSTNVNAISFEDVVELSAPEAMSLILQASKEQASNNMRVEKAIITITKMK